MECYLDPKRNVCAAQCVIMRFHHVRWWGVLFSCGSVFLVLSLHVQNGRTALYIASRKGHDQIVEELLSRGADMNRQKKVSILMWYIFLQYCDIEQDFFTVTILTVEWRIQPIKHTSKQHCCV